MNRIISGSRSLLREGRGEPRPSKAGASSRTPGPSASTLSTILLAAIRAYQAFLSPVVPAVCKFHPSCSRYAFEAIERYGARRGMRLALARVWRCRPFAPGGYDPVPEPDEPVPVQDGPRHVHAEVTR